MNDLSKEEGQLRRMHPGKSAARAAVLEWLEIWSAYQDWMGQYSGANDPAERAQLVEAGQLLRQSLKTHSSALTRLDLEAAAANGELPPEEYQSFCEAEANWKREAEIEALRGKQGHDNERNR